MFWVKKILSMLVMPIPFILLVLISCILFSQRQKIVKSLLILSVSLLVFFSSNFGMRLIVEPLEMQYAMNSQAIEGECIVLVLGSGHDLSSSDNPVQRLSPTALMRLSEGIRQLSLGKDCTLVTSGWSGVKKGNLEQSHAYVAARAAEVLGVQKGSILLQEHARDTIEEARSFQERFGSKSFRLVTSATHMSRAMSIFKQQGLQPQAAPADFISQQGYWWRLSSYNIYKCRRAIHEYVGMLWLKAKKYLPITSD